MRTLILDQENSEVHYQGHNLTVYRNGKRINTVPLKHLERVIISPQVIISAGVLGVVAEHNVTLMVLNARLPQRTAFLVGQNSGDVQRRLTQYQYALNHPFCLQMATRLVMLKVTRQRAVLQQALSTRPELSLILTRAIKLLDRSLITLTDTTLDSLTVLNGIEGAAAKAYFQGYTALFADSLHFSARNRRPPKDPVNAILSLSYTLVHHEAVNVLKMYGLDSALGFYHQPFYGRQSLACDVIEPLRPYLDRWIWRLFAQQTLRVDHFINDEQACFLNQAGKPIFYKAFFANIKPLKRLLRYYARHIVNAINQQA